MVILGSREFRATGAKKRQKERERDGWDRKGKGYQERKRKETVDPNFLKVLFWVNMFEYL